MGAQFSKGGLHNINWLSLPTLFFPLRLKFLELGEKSKRGKKNIKWEKSKPIYFNWHLLAYWNGTFIYLVWDHWCMYKAYPLFYMPSRATPYKLERISTRVSKLFCTIIDKRGCHSLLVFQSLIQLKTASSWTVRDNWCTAAAISSTVFSWHPSSTYSNNKLIH